MFALMRVWPNIFDEYVDDYEGTCELELQLAHTTPHILAAYPGARVIDRELPYRNS